IFLPSAEIATPRTSSGHGMAFCRPVAKSQTQTVSSWALETSVWPSDVYATDWMFPAWPLKLASSLPVAVSPCRRTVPQQTTRVFPSGAKIQREAPDTLPFRTCNCSPLAISQRRTVPSQLQLAIILPSAVKARHVIVPLWPRKTRCSLPVLVSQKRTVPSAPPVANSRDSGGKQQQVTPPPW